MLKVEFRVVIHITLVTNGIFYGLEAFLTYKILFYNMVYILYL